MKSYRCDLIHTRYSPPQWRSTELYFATEVEALACGKAITYGMPNPRWAATPCDQPATHQWTEEGPVRLTPQRECIE